MKALLNAKWNGLGTKAILASLMTGPVVYQVTIGKTTHNGRVHNENSSDILETKYDPNRHALSQSPLLTKINPHGHILQSDKETIRIKRSEISSPIQDSILTTAVHGIFHGYAFSIQRFLSTLFPN